MGPIIHLVRHAEALHNVEGNFDLQDPPLTGDGQLRAWNLGSATLAIRSRATHLVASPSERTILTSSKAFGDETSNPGLARILHPDFQEVQNHPCNIPEMPRIIAMRHGYVGFDLQYLDSSGSYRNREPGSRYSDETSAIVARARDARNWLRRLVQQHGENAEAVVVAHREINMYLTKDFRFWNHAELHSFEFVNWQDTESTDPEADLVYVEPEVVSVRGESLPPLPISLIPELPQALQAPQIPPTPQSPWDPPPSQAPPVPPPQLPSRSGPLDNNLVPAPPPRITTGCCFPRTPPVAVPGPPRPPSPPLTFDIVVRPLRFSPLMKMRARQMLRFQDDFPDDSSRFMEIHFAQALAVCRVFDMCSEDGETARDEEPGEERWPPQWSPRFRGQAKAITGFLNNWNLCFRER
jgi:broad specificity phosphatase PhoE